MLDIDTLRCEFVRLVYTWTGKAQWGIQCNLAYLQTLSMEFYNYIQMIENIDECDVPHTVWDDIRANIERIQAAGIADFCNNC